MEETHIRTRVNGVTFGIRFAMPRSTQPLTSRRAERRFRAIDFTRAGEMRLSACAERGSTFPPGRVACCFGCVGRLARPRPVEHGQLGSDRPGAEVSAAPDAGVLPGNGKQVPPGSLAAVLAGACLQLTPGRSVPTD